MRHITLMTDFGLKYTAVAVMRGVIYNLCLDVVITDVSHAISPQNVMEGALAIGWVAPYFPDGTVHVAVVDPGVGTHRRPMAARLGRHYFVGPDNGLFSVAIENAEKQGLEMEFIHLNRPQFWLPQVSTTFHGRDIFSPAGAHLAAGIPLGELGERIHDPVRLELPRPQQTAAGWKTSVINIDSFGNLYTSLHRDQIGGRPVRVSVAGRQIDGLVRTFGERPAGELVALIDAADFLSISIVNGSAARELNAHTGDPVDVSFS